jgi:predicted PurR-regulated permease PerM
MSGSAVKEGAGARTQVANLVAWGATIVTLLFLTPAALGEQHPLLVGLERYGTEVRRYLVVRTELGLFAAVLSALLLFVLGVPLPLLWAVLVFVASFIPNIGALIAVIPPTVLAYLDGGIGVAAAVIIGYALINLVQDQFLQPVVMGSELNLSPLAVFIAVVVWVWILGPAGALLAVPLTVALVMLLESSPSSQGIASLFRDRVDPDPGTTS